MTKKRRWSLMGAGAGVALLLLVWLLPGEAVVVETARVGRDTLRTLVQEEGRTRVRDRYVVSAPVTGRLSRVPVEEGDAVAEDEVLARIASAPDDPRSLGVTRAQLSGAEARREEAATRVEEARARAGQLAREAERSRTLQAAGALSLEALEQAELAAGTALRQMEGARAALAVAEADVAAARAALSGGAPGSVGVVEVRAPGPGRVLRVLEESERVVAAGTPLVEVGDARGLEVVVDVLSEDAVRISPGDPVLIDEWGGEETLHGRVRAVEPAAFTEISALGVEEQRVNVVVDLARSPASLGAGYRVVASIVTWAGEDVLTIPTSALFQRDGGWRAFVVEDGRAALRAVELGQRAAEAAEVAGGIAEGTEVILFPSDEVEEGIRVRAEAPSPEEAP